MAITSCRRSALKDLVAGAALLSSVSLLTAACADADHDEGLILKGRIKQSVCRWCYPELSLEDLAHESKAMGLRSIDLLGPEDWSVIQPLGLTCALPFLPGLRNEKGFNDSLYHDELIASYEAFFPKLAAAGLTTIICFSGNRNGISDEEGLVNCTKGIKRLIESAEQHKITLIMELLNSRVNHKDYQADKSEWGVELCKRVDSERFKLLYDIYHMQIMEGNIIATIQRNHMYFGHYHTGGVPGRAEIDTAQELNYPAIMKAIVHTGYQGYVGHEFIPKSSDAVASLKQAVIMCDI